MRQNRVDKPKYLKRSFKAIEFWHLEVDGGFYGKLFSCGGITFYYKLSHCRWKGVGCISNIERQTEMVR